MENKKKQSSTTKIVDDKKIKNVKPTTQPAATKTATTTKKQSNNNNDDTQPKSILKKNKNTTTTTTTPAAKTTTINKNEKKKTSITNDSSSKTVIEKEDTVPVTPTTSKIITVGCYENSIIGFEAIRMEDHPELGNPDELEVHLEQIFAYASHAGCIKSIASGSQYLVSSSTDETVKVYNLSRQEEFGQLVKHEGFVSSLKFYKDSHLIASSRDHTISVWNVNGWDCLKQLKGHKDAVNWVSIHPSGKVALSVGKDCRLFLWDLLRGVAAHYQKTKDEPFIVEWSKSGQHFVVVYANRLVIHTADGKELHTYPTKQPMLAVHFYDDDTLLAGGDDKFISFIDYKKGTLIKQFTDVGSRIKALGTLSFDGDDDSSPYIVSLSSDGNIIIWNVESEMPVGFAETGARLTCLAISDVINGESNYQGRDEIEEEEEMNQEAEEEEQIKHRDGPKMKVDVKYDQDMEDDKDEVVDDKVKEKPRKLTEEEYIDFMLSQPNGDDKPKKGGKGGKKVGIKKNHFKGKKPSLSPKKKVSSK